MAERTGYGQDLMSKRETLDERLDRTGSQVGDLPKSEFIRRDIEATRASLDEKLDALQHKARDLQTKAKHAVDLPYQVQQHPWAMVGASLAAGFVAGSLIGGHSESHLEAQRFEPSFEVEKPAKRSKRERKRRFAGLGRDLRGNEFFESIKLAAGAALTDLLRNALRKHVPAFGEQLDRIWKEKGLTPTTAASALLDSMRSRRTESSGPSASYGSSSYSSAGSFGTAPEMDERDISRAFQPSPEHEPETAVRGEMSTRT